jgi:hypothetical protein
MNFVVFTSRVARAQNSHIHPFSFREQCGDGEVRCVRGRCQAKMRRLQRDILLLARAPSDRLEERPQEDVQVLRGN